MTAGTGTYSRIWSTVRRIPKGRVSTYGRIAALARLPGHARQVGYALHALIAGTAVPWQRVVNAKGEISRRSGGGGNVTQRILLEREGISFNSRGRIDLGKYGWPRPG